jgi:hypothetical protein
MEGAIMSEIPVNAEMVANCGLYCGACRSYLKGRCRGCVENSKATWCKVRSCCAEKQIKTCAQCTEVAEPAACGKFNNRMSRLFGLVFRSDRAACIAQIKRLGLEGHARAMAESGRHSIKR